jgi:tRNA threonylcarbamoyladenosine biosynthesis protein TsaB
MRVLGIDVCTGFCAVAVIEDDRALASIREPMERGHAERLAPMVAEAFECAGLAPPDLDAIAVTTGPGSFTGARLGVSLARGLALALDIPAVGISVFRLLAANVEQRPLVVALNGKHEHVAMQLFNNDAPDEPSIYAVKTAWQDIPEGAFALSNSDFDAVRSHAPEEFAVRELPVPETDAVEVARLGLEQLATGEIGPPTPLYLRAPDAKVQPVVSL